MESLLRPLRAVSPLAALVIVLLHMGIGAAWYGLFAAPWLAAIGKTNDDFAGVSPAIFLLPIIAALLNTWIVAIVLERVGRRSLVSGVAAALVLWLGAILPYDLVTNTFGAFPLSLTLIDSGCALLTTLATGMVLAVWPVRVPTGVMPATALPGAPAD